MAVVADKRTPGKFLARYWDEAGVRKTPGFESRPKAEFHLMLHAGPKSLKDLGGIHFSGLTLYYEHVQLARLREEERLAPNGLIDPRSRLMVQGYVKLFKERVVPVLDGVTIAKIDSSHLVDLEYALLDDYSRRRIGHVIGQVRLALRMAADRQGIEDALTREDRKKHRGRRRRGRSGPLDREGVAAAVPEHHLEATRESCRTHELVCIDLMAEAGATLAEANAVEEERLDLRGRLVAFENELVQSQIRRLPDPVSRRAVTMSDRLAATLIRAIVVRRQSGDPSRRLVPTSVTSPTLGLIQARAGLNPWPSAHGKTARPRYTATMFRDRAAIRWCFPEDPEAKAIGKMALAARLGVRGHRRVDKRYGKYLKSHRNRREVTKVNASLDGPRG